MEVCLHHCHPAADVSPDSNNLAPVKHNPIHLSDEDGCHGLVKRRSVHVYGGTHREDETGHPLVDAQVLFQASERDRQSTGADDINQKKRLNGKFEPFILAILFKKTKSTLKITL